MAVVVAHGAGSTGDAARALLGPCLQGHDVIAIEDRSGDVQTVTSLLDEVVGQGLPVSHIIGISLGAHAAARWAAAPRVSERARPCLVLVLPAWTGAADATATLTAAAGQAVAQNGIEAELARMRRTGAPADIRSLLEMSWPDYGDTTLAQALLTASRSRGPTPAELNSIDAPTLLVAWAGDPLHPLATARDWTRLIGASRLAVAARPDVRLLQAALATGLPAALSRPS